MVGTCFMLNFRWVVVHTRRRAYTRLGWRTLLTALSVPPPSLQNVQEQDLFSFLQLLADIARASYRPFGTRSSACEKIPPSVLDTSCHVLTVLTNHERPYNLRSSQHPLSLPPRFMMGRPQYSNSKSNNKDKSKSKSTSHKTKPSSTMPASSSSSMGPQNGSAIE
jgi:hypothetical protein